VHVALGYLSIDRPSIASDNEVAHVVGSCRMWPMKRGEATAIAE